MLAIVTRRSLSLERLVPRCGLQRLRPRALALLHVKFNYSMQLYQTLSPRVSVNEQLRVTRISSSYIRQSRQCIFIKTHRQSSSEAKGPATALYAKSARPMPTRGRRICGLQRLRPRALAFVWHAELAEMASLRVYSAETWSQK